MSFTRRSVNTPQRIVLIIGAIAVLGVIFATPRVGIAEGRVLPEYSGLAPVVDVRTAGSTLVGVVVTTIFLFFAIGPNTRTRDRLSVVEDRVDQLTRDVAALETHVTEPHSAPRGSTT